jgi:hypothetical protein
MFQETQGNRADFRLVTSISNRRVPVTVLQLQPGNQRELLVQLERDNGEIVLKAYIKTRKFNNHLGCGEGTEFRREAPRAVGIAKRSSERSRRFSLRHNADKKQEAVYRRYHDQT